MSERRMTTYEDRASRMRSYDYSRGYGRNHGTPGRSGASERSARNYSMQYYYGSEAPALEPYEELYREERRRQAPRRSTPVDDQARRNRARARQMSPALIAVFISAAVVISAALCFYISLRSAVTTAGEEVASLQSQLNTLKAANDQEQNQVNNSISIDDVKYRAMTDLGMSYASGDQVIEYSGDDDDYMHQLQDVDGQ